MKNLNMNSLTKSFKSMKIVKMINSSLVKLAKLMNIQPKILYVILTLLLVLLIALGLGTSIEGFDSMSNANTALTQIVNNMNGSINYIFDWNSDSDKTTFKNNINFWFNKKMIYLVNQRGNDLQTFDLNNNSQIYKLNPALHGAKDASGNDVPMFVDDTKPPEPTPQFLQQYTLIDIKTSITSTELNVLTKQITDKINSFSSVDPTGQVGLQDAFDALRTYAESLAAYVISHPSETTGVPSFANILSQGTLTRSTDDDYTDERYKEERAKIDKEYEERYKKEKEDEYKKSREEKDKEKIEKEKRDKEKKEEKERRERQEYKEYIEKKEREKNAARYNTASYNPVSSSSTSGPSVASSGYQWGNAGADSIGVSQSNIPAGSQDMYMLKSQVVPPTNPAGASTRGAAGAAGTGAAGTGAGAGSAPATNVNPSPCQANNCKPAPVPPCPPCERCPEPAFDCKKVPNYNSASVNQYLPQPMLADFSQFGM